MSTVLVPLSLVSDSKSQISASDWQSLNQGLVSPLGEQQFSLVSSVQVCGGKASQIGGVFRTFQALTFMLL